MNICTKYRCVAYYVVSLVNYLKILGSVKMKIYNKYICVVTYSLRKYYNFINTKTDKN
jgi:hypothetical protein